MTALAFTAYAAWILLMASLFRRMCPQDTGRAAFAPVRAKASGIIASCLGVGAFFFVPPGSLPPFCNAPWGGFFLLGLLFLAALAEKDRKGFIALLPISCAALVCFWYAYERGMPGSAANLGTFVGIPLWSILPPWQFCAFLPLAVIFLFSARMHIPADAGISHAAAIRHLAVCALFVAFFAPWNTAPYLPWPDILVAGCDFIFFWAKTLCLAALLRRRATV